MNRVSNEKKREILSDVNEAKDRLYEVSQRLEEAGFHRKAESAMTLIYQIEAWQNRD